MANFATHLNVSAFVSAVSAVSIGYSPIANPSDCITLFFVGIVGGMLPDIDHDKSIPTNIVKFFFSNLIAFFLTYKFIGKYPLLNIIFIWIGAYILFSIFFYFFKRVTKHRGIIHSIPAGIIFALLTSLISYYYFNLSLKKSYLLGFFIFIGYITHLVLDEIYSVDISNQSIKRSFGSALKLYSHNKVITLLTYMILIALFLALPNKEYFFNLFKGILNV